MAEIPIFYWFCLIFGHKWKRFGYPNEDDNDIDKDDQQMFGCLRCGCIAIVKHNGCLPRIVKGKGGE